MLYSCSTLFCVCYYCNSDVMIVLLGTKFIHIFSFFLPYMYIDQYRSLYNESCVSIAILIHLMINVMILVVNMYATFYSYIYIYI